MHQNNNLLVAGLLCLFKSLAWEIRQPKRDYADAVNVNTDDVQVIMHGYGDRDYGEAAHGADLGPLPDAEDGPVFDFVDTRNVTSVVRGVAVLRCSVHNLGERTVR